MPSQPSSGPHLLVRQGDARPLAADRSLACSLALAAGARNTVGFYKIGIYSSHMTGTVSTLADRVALGDWAGALVCLGLPRLRPHRQLRARRGGLDAAGE